MSDTDLRWRQRFDNVQRALLVLERGVDIDIDIDNDLTLIGSGLNANTLSRINSQLDDLLAHVERQRIVAGRLHHGFQAGIGRLG